MSLKKNPSVNPKTLRQQAEAAHETSRSQVKKMSLPEIQHLVHELQVHQIELEMQNEELRHTQLDLQQARDRYATLFDFTPVGYATLDGDGRILEANLTLCHLVGVLRKTILYEKFEEFVDPEDQPAFRLHLETLKKKAGTQSSDVLTLRHPQIFHRVRLESCLETMESSGLVSLFRIAIVDVTERERIAAAQEEHQALMEVVVGGVMEAIVTADEDERIVLFNEAAAKMFRCPASSALGQPIDRFIPKRFRVGHFMNHRQFGQAAVASRQMGAARDVIVQRADGEEFPAEMTISKVEVKGWGKRK
ncbi:MAG: PAS domain-containing protein, partial [Nitrospirales bacterium]